jgi:ribosome-binding protein aMBF1 (putative translation factor)
LKPGKTPAWLGERVPIAKIIAAVEQAKEEKWADFKDRYGDGGTALTLKLARRRSGLTQGELARRLDLAPSVNISMIIKRYEKHLATNRPERKTAGKAEQMLNAMIRPR